jgi:ABC-type transporter Mla subunit MlaD
MTNKQIGYFTLAFLVVFVTVFALYIHFTYIHGWTVRTVLADDIGNLKIDNPIKVSGMAVGAVQSIGREGNRAKLAVKMRDNIAIKKDYMLLNMDVGLMGDRVLVLYPGKHDEPLPDGAPLNARFLNGIAEGIRNADTLKYVIQDLKVIFKKYSRVDPENDSLFTTKFRKVLKELDRTSAGLEKMLVRNEKKITRGVRLAGSLAGQTRRMARRFKPVLSRHVRATERLSKEAIVIIEKLAPLIDELAVYVEAIEKGENSVGKVLLDRTLYTKLINTIAKIRKVIQSIGDEGVKLDVDIF